MLMLGWGHRTKYQKLAVGQVAGWVAGPGYDKNNATSWLHLAR